jgi:hypothetical protein
MIKIQCYSRFDITATGVTISPKQVTFPFETRQGLIFRSSQDLTKARNQQRNFDTLMQLIGLRTQVFNASVPERLEDPPLFPGCRAWRFDFEVEPKSQWLVDDDDFWLLKHDSQGTPMIISLDESSPLDPWIVTDGNNPNIIYHAG